ncbi:MAG: tyrosine--tRNA ligase [Spirochaetaceae bacterium]|jgi:tyrosyl-tRNA synthetase|nr:tyrosine--tRNA ligase [Spirochaetaceae bacterium]
MNDMLGTLKSRGFFAQCTDAEGLSAAMDRGPVTFYVGCDPTGPSLHIGHMVPFFAFRHLIRAGHRGIALIGGGTARIGDPSGKTEMRRILDYETLDANAASISAQLGRFLEGGGSSEGIRFANNRDWLADLNYIDFLREIGSHFSVNRMLSFEAYKQRMETGLSFLEFNYQLLQSYDFLELHRRYGCILQIGGDDQWGNIVAGADLIRRVLGTEAFGMTFPLVTTGDGKKMGKTERGAIFLDPARTSPYEFFQYWRNVQDSDVQRFLLLFTFLSEAECEGLCAPGKNPNEAKERLAWEVTALIHGEDEAGKALAGAKAAFGGGDDKSAMPAVTLSRARFEAGYNIVDLFTDAGLAASKSESRRLVEQGGAFVSGRPPAGAPSVTRNLEALTSVDAVIGADRLDASGELILRAGKKRYRRVIT